MAKINEFLVGHRPVYLDILGSNVASVYTSLSAGCKQMETDESQKLVSGLPAPDVIVIISLMVHQRREWPVYYIMSTEVVSPVNMSIFCQEGGDNYWAAVAVSSRCFPELL